jgi:DNA-binding transcriptional LysR family regulator
MGAAASAASLTAGGRTTEIEGPIAIAASEIYSAHLLPPVIAKLRRIAPGIEVEIVASNAVADLRRREADIAIRNFHSTQTDLIAKKLRDDHARLYATPDYLAGIGDPQTPEDLNRADFIAFDRSPMMIEGLNALGLNLARRNFPLMSESHLVHWALVKQGLGIGIVPQNVGDAEPLVRRALPDLAPLTFPIWLTTHRELNTSRRVRLVFDLLAEELR